MPTLAASCVQVILRLAKNVITPSDHFLGLYSDIDNAVQDGNRLDIAEAAKLIVAITAESGELDVGLCSYDLFHPGQLNAQLYAIMSSATLGEALETAERFSALLSDGAPICITKDAGAFSINFLCIESLGLTRQYIDCCLSTMVGLAHWLLPWDKPTPLAAAFSYPEPEDRTRLERIFGSHLVFSHHVNKITFSLEDWARPLSTANAALKLYHCTYAHEELAKRQQCIASTVKKHIYAGLQAGTTVSLESVARTLHLSVRTLQNRLDEEATGFRLLLDDCRKQLAEQLLLASEASVASIAVKLNFRNSSSFHKACNRWFACSPGAYRGDRSDRISSSSIDASR